MKARDAAAAYLRMGWSVIPLKPASAQNPKQHKFPDGPWAEFHNRIMSPEEVTEKFKDENGVGIVTGRISGLVVVDVDPARGGDYRQILDRFPTGRVAQTGGGGYHLFYRYPKSGTVGNFVDVLPGIDIRGDGGQVVAAPTRAPSGQTYRWLHEGPITEFPTGILRRGREGQTTPAEDGWAIALLENGAPEGTRDDSTARLAGLLARQKVPEDLAVRLLRAWNKAVNPVPLPVEDIDKTVHSVYRTDARHQSEKPREEATHLNLVPFDVFMATFSNNANWMVEEWLPDRTILFIIAEPGSYKTWLSFDLAQSVATGAPFLGQYKVHRTGPVVIFQQEDYNGQTQERLSVIAYSKFNIGQPVVGEDGSVTFPPIPKIPIYVHPDRQLRFDDADAMASLREICERLQPALVIIDPLYAAGPTDDYMTKLVEYMAPLKGLRDEFGTSFAIIHHRKKGGSVDDREGAWGSQFVNAYIESGWQVTGAPPKGSGKIQVGRHFKSAPPQQNLFIQFNIDTTPTGFKYRPEIATAASPEDEKADSDMIKIESAQAKENEAIKMARAKGGVSPAELADALEIHRTTAHRMLKRLEKSGHLIFSNGKFRPSDQVM